MSLEFGRPPNDLAVRNITVDKNLTSCPGATIRVQTVDACQVNFLELNGGSASFDNLMLDELVVNDLTVINQIIIGPETPPITGLASACYTPTITLIGAGGVIQGPIQDFSYQRINDTYTIGGLVPFAVNANVTGSFDFTLPDAVQSITCGGGTAITRVLLSATAGSIVGTCEPSPVAGQVRVTLRNVTGFPLSDQTLVGVSCTFTVVPLP